MTNDLQDAVGRVVWRDGQVLDSLDLNGEVSDEARRRRLHVRYMHQTWGIALGFTVQATTDGVIVGPGYAIDTSGRDLLLPDTVQLPLLGDGTYVLAASYDTTAQCRPTLLPTDFCPGLNPNVERAALTWIAAQNLTAGAEVPLARAVISGGSIVGGLDLRVRVNARRIVKPHISSGVTETGATGWMDESGIHAPTLYLQVQIDTSGGGFLSTPTYFAALLREGLPALHPRSGSLDEAAKPFGNQPAFSLDGLGEITKATAQGFTFRMPRGTLPLGVDLTAKEAEDGGWVVAWVGLEQVTGFEPLLDITAIIALLGAFK